MHHASGNPGCRPTPSLGGAKASLGSPEKAERSSFAVGPEVRGLEAPRRKTMSSLSSPSSRGGGCGDTRATQSPQNSRRNLRRQGVAGRPSTPVDWANVWPPKTSQEGSGTGSETDSLGLETPGFSLLIHCLSICYWKMLQVVFVYQNRWLYFLLWKVLLYLLVGESCVHTTTN